MFDRSRLILTAAAVALLAGSGAGLARSNDLPFSSGREPTLAGSYLAGRIADIAQDMTAATLYYSTAIHVDPANAGLTERVVLLGLSSGELDRAFAAARSLVRMHDDNPPARLALAVEAVKNHDFAQAKRNLEKMARADLSTLTAGLVHAWIDVATGDQRAGLERISKLRGPGWYQVFKTYHTAIITDLLGDKAAALRHIRAAYANDDTALRVVEGYARIQARAGNAEEAIKALIKFGGERPLHPVIRTLLEDIRAGKDIAPIASSAEEGIAEALYGLGSAIGINEGAELPAAYLRLAGYLDPDAHLVTMALGDVFQAVRRCEDAIDIYATVPVGDPMRRNADIQTGNCSIQLEKFDEAISTLKSVVDANPLDIEAGVELGNVYRYDSKFELASEAYTNAMNAMENKDDIDWRLYYFRGIAYERSKQWPLAEADFKKALELNPDQPQVLNYLGYSWIDQHLNLEEALGMIWTSLEKSLPPNPRLANVWADPEQDLDATLEAIRRANPPRRREDGSIFHPLAAAYYIVDSIGWAYYRLENYESAVKLLEMAAELSPEDPVVNDHLGDAYWKVGRKREALFQWAHARDLEPEDDELPKILAKLEKGLDGV